MEELPTLRPKGRGVGAMTNVLLVDGEGERRFAIIERCARRDQVASCHIHAREDEIIYVLAGRVLVQIGEARRSYGPGGCIFLPRGYEHAIGAESDEARLLTIALPAGIEEYYRELDGAQAGTDDEIERQITLAARYGVTITGSAFLP
jgi:quercetin dioxygenase-like cupin family protein